MTEQYNEIRSGAHVVSRRTIAAGAAWAVPTVALATSTPAFAASQPVCYPVSFTTTGSTSASTQYVQSNGGQVKVTSGVQNSSSSTYKLPGGTTYTPLMLTSTGGSVSLSTYKSPTATMTADRTGYAYIDLEFPAGSVGPISFTIAGIEKYPTTTNPTNGTNNYNDSVSVLVNGQPVAPSSSSNVIVQTFDGASWATALDGNSGTATYTVGADGAAINTIRIRLSNAFQGTIADTTVSHPNQTVTIGPLTCGTVAVPPTPTCVPSPYSRTWVQWLFDDYSGREHLDVAMSLQIGNLPAGVTVESITWDLWFRGGTRGGLPGQDIPIWNSNLAYGSGGVAVSDRRLQSASSLPWTPGVAGFNSTAKSSTIALTSHTFLTGTTANAWNLQFSWTGNAGQNGTYTKDANGCVDFDTTKSNPFRINYSSARTVSSMGSGWAGWTSYLEDMYYTATLSNGCVLEGTFSADVYPTDQWNTDLASYREVIKHNVTQTC